MQIPSTPPTPPRLRRALTSACAVTTLACLFGASASAQTMEFFGDWVQPTAQEFYVSSTATAPFLGTLQNPAQTVTQALALPNMNLGVDPVTINVMDPGPFTAALGEVYPIMLPAHGISIEAYGANGALPTFLAQGSAGSETFFFNTVGNPDLPDSVLRGLELQNDDLNPGVSSVLRIEAMNPTPAEALRVAPEVRDCRIISNGASYGVRIASEPGIELVPVLERNWIDYVQGKESAATAGVWVLGDVSPTSPLIRANEIQHYPTNVLLEGGDLTHQTRLQGNFIQVGGTNVRVDGCAPFVIGNTIAYADDPLAPVGIEWVNVIEMALINNLIWNPTQPGSMIDPIDAQGDPLVFTGGDRMGWFNYDEDEALFAMGLPASFGPILLGAPPGFVGGDLGQNQLLTDLLLTPGSVIIEIGEAGEYLPVTSGAPFPSTEVPGAPGPIVVRRDQAHDIDFEPRIVGFLPEMGADEFTGIATAAVVAFGRGASIAPTVGSPFGADLDDLGNLSPAAGQWLTSVDILGTPGDLVILLSGVGFFDTINDPAFPGIAIENTALHQNFLMDSSVLPGLISTSSIGIDLGAGQANVGFVVIPAGGVASLPVNFGAVNAAFLEGEAHLQGIAFDPALTLVQATNRLTLELNE
ncbi:MAG: hypothetical protein P1V81_12840 [Planctomycetota bacterium]|nr:hypothetical protein [Planctomycetota bacterium]